MEEVKDTSWLVWKVESKTDPRWNNKGELKYLYQAQEDDCLAGKNPPQNFLNWFNKCSEEFGEPPADLKAFCIKKEELINE